MFDLLHFGHINYFREAKKNGDIVIASITADKYVLKGPEDLISILKIEQK